MKKEILILLIAIIPCLAIAQTDSIELSFYSVEIDTATVNVFDQVPNAKFKLDFYHTDGYSTGNRYWYEIIIIDSLMILNFKSPDNDDWNYINYQKQVVLEEEVLAKIKLGISESKLNQIRKGIPKPPGTGYGADRLYVESDSLNLAGGTVYMCVGADMSDEDYQKRISKEKYISSTISGDYQAVFDMLEELFTDLPMLMKSKNKEY